MSAKFAAVAFDLDGTLYPNASLQSRLLPFFARNWRLLLAFDRARGLIRGEQERRPDLARPDFYDWQAELTAGFLGAAGLPVDASETKALIERRIYRGLEPLFRKVRLFPHVVELLAELRLSGLKVGLLSDFPPEAKLENLGLAGAWDAALCSERCGALKPSAVPFNALAEALGREPGETLYVGNSAAYDALGARRAGMKAALVSLAPGSAKFRSSADFVFRDYRKLRDFVLN